MTDDAAFRAFVATRSPGLLRTAYLITHDQALAEDLLQTALMKTWFAWDRLNDDPLLYVRRVLFTTSVSWWRRRWTGEVPTEKLPSLRGRATWTTAPWGRTSGSRSVTCRCVSEPLWSSGSTRT